MLRMACYTAATMRESPYLSQFEKYAQELDATNEKRERLVKASRDVTMSSKKVIFQIHRMSGTDRQKMLQKAEQDLEMIQTNHIRRIAQELREHENWKYRRAFSAGMQEYVEAATALEFFKTGQLLTLQDLNAGLSHLQEAFGVSFRISLPDYILGLGDLSGELMRLAISGVAAGQREAANEVCTFVRALYQGCSQLPSIMENQRDMVKKMDVMLQSLIKIETTCYAVHVRGSEYPENMIVDALERQQADSDE